MIIIDGKMIKKFLVLLFILIFSGSINFANAQPLGTFTFPPNPSIFPGPVTFLGSVSGAVGNLCTSTPEANGGKGDGVTDDTTAIQAAINIAQILTTNGGGTVCLGPKTYKLTTALSITKNLSFIGAGVEPVFSVGTNNQSYSDVSPFLVGSVLLQTGAAQDGITISCGNCTVNLRDFGIRFSPAFSNTGNGITLNPSAYNGKQDVGCNSCNWNNIEIWGHDGNHYGFSLTNIDNGSFNHLIAFGGGGMLVANNMTTSQSGFSTFTDPHLEMFSAGTAKTLTLSNPGGGGADLWHVSFTGAYLGVTCCTSGSLGETPIASTGGQTFVSWDLTGAGQGVIFLNPTLQASGAYGGLPTAQGFPFAQNPSRAKTYLLVAGSGNNNGQLTMTADAALTSGLVFLNSANAFASYINGGTDDPKIQTQALAGVGNAVTVAAGANAGTSPPAPVVGSSKDLRGLITFGTGTTPAAGAQVVVTLSRTYNAAPVSVTVTPQNAVTQALGLYVSNITTNSFTLSCTTAPAASQANTIYSFSYVIVD